MLTPFMLPDHLRLILLQLNCAGADYCHSLPATAGTHVQASLTAPTQMLPAHLRSSYTVISTGMIIPALSCVAALYSLQNCMMLTPCSVQSGAMHASVMHVCVDDSCRNPASSHALLQFPTFFLPVCWSFFQQLFNHRQR